MTKGKQEKIWTHRTDRSEIDDIGKDNNRRQKNFQLKK